MYTTVLFSLTGGNLLRWFRDQWGQPEVAEAARTGADPYELLTQAMAAEPTDLMVLPYFTPSGTPYFDAEVPGAILGLRLAHHARRGAAGPDRRRGPGDAAEPGDPRRVGPGRPAIAGHRRRREKRAPWCNSRPTCSIARSPRWP